MIARFRFFSKSGGTVFRRWHRRTAHGDDMAEGGCCSPPRFVSNSHGGEKSGNIRQNHLIFVQAMEKIFGQESFQPPPPPPWTKLVPYAYGRWRSTIGKGTLPMKPIVPKTGHSTKWLCNDLRFLAGVYFSNNSCYIMLGGSDSNEIHEYY